MVFLSLATTLMRACHMAAASPLGLSVSGRLWDPVRDELQRKDNTLTHEEAHTGNKSISHLQRSPDRVSLPGRHPHSRS